MALIEIGRHFYIQSADDPAEWLTARMVAERLQIQSHQLRSWLNDPVRGGWLVPRRWQTGRRCREYPWPFIADAWEHRRQLTIMTTTDGVGLFPKTVATDHQRREWRELWSIISASR
jgi:hypothetical protein